jgi:large subunit ribosomal protein L24
MKIKKDDTVLIISGKDRTRKAKVIEVFPKKGRIVAEGINLRKKHVRPKKQGEKGQIVTVATPFDASAAKLICPKCSKITRVGYKIENKKKHRICKKCGQEV